LVSRGMRSSVLCIVGFVVGCVGWDFGVCGGVGGLGCWVVACVHELILLLYPGEKV